jgi:hypothetical protein
MSSPAVFLNFFKPFCKVFGSFQKQHSVQKVPNRYAVINCSAPCSLPLQSAPHALLLLSSSVSHLAQSRLRNRRRRLQGVKYLESVLWHSCCPFPRAKAPGSIRWQCGFGIPSHLSFHNSHHNPPTGYPLSPRCHRGWRGVCFLL